MAKRQPMAYAVEMLRGHEYDYLVFANEEDAHDEIANIPLEEGDEEPVIIPLYPAEEWREKPPDTEGIWLCMTKERTVGVLTIPHEALGDVKEYVPGDLWLRLPPYPQSLPCP